MDFASKMIIFFEKKQKNESLTTNNCGRLNCFLTEDVFMVVEVVIDLYDFV